MAMHFRVTVYVSLFVVWSFSEYSCFACPNGYFGLDCREKCSTYCSGNGSCSQITGVCDKGCKDGWSGSKCGTRINAACPNGYFGLDCREKCSTYCSGDGSCSQITGVCDKGCKDGWSGSKCGTRINADESTKKGFTIGAFACSGVFVTAVLTVLIRRKKVSGRRKKPTNAPARSSHIAHGPVINNYHCHCKTAIIVTSDSLDVKRCMAASPTSELPVINPSA